MSTGLRLADRWFRAWGVATLLALAATAVSLATRRGEWRVPFVLAHLAAMVALGPLAIVLQVEALADAFPPDRSPNGGAAALFRRQRVVVLLLAVLAVALVISLANQNTRTLRAPANLVSVAVVVVLVVRYLRWSRDARARAR